MKRYCIGLGVGLNMFFCEFKFFYPPVEEKPKYVNQCSKKKRKW